MFNFALTAVKREFKEYHTDGNKKWTKGQGKKGWNKEGLKRNKRKQFELCTELSSHKNTTFKNSFYIGTVLKNPDGESIVIQYFKPT